MGAGVEVEVGVGLAGEVGPGPVGTLKPVSPVLPTQEPLPACLMMASIPATGPPRIEVIPASASCTAQFWGRRASIHETTEPSTRPPALPAKQL